MSNEFKNLVLAVAQAAINGWPLPVAGDWKIIKGRIYHDDEVVGRFEKVGTSWEIRLIDVQCASPEYCTPSAGCYGCNFEEIQEEVL